MYANFLIVLDRERRRRGAHLKRCFPVAVQGVDLRLLNLDKPLHHRECALHSSDVPES
jgi:hypothetical protein